MLLKLWKSSRSGNARCRALNFRFLARFRKDTCGGVLIYSAFMLPVLLSVSGLAVDASLWYGHKRDLQATADVAALTAALEMTRIDDETLSAPSTGPYAGILMYGDPNATGNVQHHVNGDNNMLYEGFLYFPSAELQFNGNGTGTTDAEYLAIIARVLEFGGNGELYFNYDADNPNVPPLPLGGTVAMVE